MNKATGKAALYRVVAHAYVNTDSEIVRGGMERALERLLQEHRERQELRKLISAYLHARYGRR